MIHNPENTALVDMDGVLFAFDETVRQRMEELHPDIQPLDPSPNHFSTAENYPPEHQHLVWAISNTPGFVRSLPIVEDAVLGLERIMAAGFVPQICSTPLPPEHVPDCVQQKVGSLTEHFAKPMAALGVLIVETAVFTRNKQDVPGAILIDDKPPHLMNTEGATWVHGVFDRPCNRTDPDNHIRIRGWNDPALPDMLAEAQERYIRNHRTTIV